ncbi:MAG: Nudix family hydrolase [Ferrovum sp.]|nr:Nudix family hydrolase [Ferrovum sp.]
MNRVEVVVAVLLDRQGRYLLAQRPLGKVYAGYWELPGGKVEVGETLRAALTREIREELGVEIRDAFPWITRHFDYAHARVRLHLFRVTQWVGQPQPLEDQQLAWQGLGCEPVSPMLPANAPILQALELPIVYGVTHAAHMGEPAFLEALERAFYRGLRLVQLREKDLPAELLQKLAEKVVHAARPWQARVLINGDVTVARAVGAAGVHLTAQQLTTMTVRPDLPLVAASCHSVEDLRRAEALGLDFVVLGPVAHTATHPQSVPLGFEALAHMIEDCGLPVLGIGGLGLSDREAAWRSGAHGVASMRALWDGETPIPNRFRS